jgi:rRNA-processing protein FCF1
MKKVILDTSFILTCVRNGIDFIEELKLRGFDFIIFKKVIEEIEKSKTKESKVSLKLLEKKKALNLGKSHADKQIIIFANKNPDFFVATLDKEIMKTVSNKKIIIQGKKKLEIIS